MAEESKKPNDNKEMMKIPVFSVLKNGTIFKNIFLNNPQWLSNEEDRGFSDSPILIGRHPDCHIVLDHPSVSRFHLEIRAKPASLSLSVTDRSSVHGTWVCGNKIQPYIPIDLAEGDTVRLGVSTRVYSLHWVPLSSAIEMENPLPAVLEEENEETQKEKPNEAWTEELPLVPPALEGENQSPLVTESAGSLLPTEGEKNANADEVQSERRVTPSGLLSRRSKSKSVGFLCVETGRKEQKYGETREEVVGNTEPGKREEETYCRTLSTELDDDDEEEEEAFVSDKENMTPFSSTAQKLKRNCIEMQGTFNSSIDLSLKDELTKERGEEILIQDFSSCNAFHSDKENWTPEVPKELKSNETFVSDKDNMTPWRSEKLASKSHDGREQLTERRKERVPFQSLLENSPSRNNSPASYRERLLLPLQPPIEKSPRGNNTIPDNYADEGNMNSSLSHYQAELHNSSGECMNIPVDYVQRLIDEGNANFSFSHNETADDKLHNSSRPCMEAMLLHKEGEKKQWNMVVDVDCLLNEESRKSLQLMEGLKGTHLIIPRIVIRELDCLKRRESRLLLFRREMKAAATSALQWIEGCMAKLSWWIHVQTSSETLPLPPTPPATPRSQLGDDSEEFGAGASSSSVAFSSCGSLMEIVSPTAEDHILDCALLFMRTKGDEQLVVLSNSITLKIKAMAEGLICETLKEFHTSLVNPYSTRFLWSASSPRGPTWSCLDEAVLIENYYQQFPALRRMEKPTDVVKGLKLILLHNNFHYGKTNLVE